MITVRAAFPGSATIRDRFFRHNQPSHFGSVFEIFVELAELRRDRVFGGTDLNDEIGCAIEVPADRADGGQSAHGRRLARYHDWFGDPHEARSRE